MKTPKNYVENLKNGIVTNEMLEDVLYSYNKRAKNYRDKEREYRRIRICDNYNNEEKNRILKEKLYKKKETLLKYTTKYLACVHKLSRTEFAYVYENDDEYNKIPKENIIYEGEDYDIIEQRNVKFREIKKDSSLFFLFYDFPNRSFHTPISKEELRKYENLEQIEIDKLKTKGKDINDLLPLQFCDKVLEFITKKNEI